MTGESPKSVDLPISKEQTLLQAGNLSQQENLWELGHSAAEHSWGQPSRTDLVTDCHTAGVWC